MSCRIRTALRFYKHKYAFVYIFIYFLHSKNAQFKCPCACNIANYTNAEMLIIHRGHDIVTGRLVSETKYLGS